MAAILSAVARCYGLPTSPDALDSPVSPRGFRLLARVPRLPAGIIDRLVYRDDKLAAVPILKDRILDKQNAWQLYQHFTYREDKMKVQEMLEH